MTDYAKHIDGLETLKYACGGQYDECLDAALKLMHGAAASSTEAELEHIDTPQADLLERAAARAEGARSGAEAYTFKIDGALSELTAAQAEIERLRAENEQRKQACFQMQALRVEDATEIERLRANLAGRYEDIGALQNHLRIVEQSHGETATKLTNLREAAERVIKTWRKGQGPRR